MGYKVVEVSPVDEGALEEALNRWAAEGYRLERLELVQQPGVRRPVMAFVFLWRDEPAP
jgi:hypothetical protein